MPAKASCGPGAAGAHRFQPRDQHRLAGKQGQELGIGFGQVGRQQQNHRVGARQPHAQRLAHRPGREHRAVAEGPFAVTGLAVDHDQRDASSAGSGSGGRRPSPAPLRPAATAASAPRARSRATNTVDSAASISGSSPTSVAVCRRGSTGDRPGQPAAVAARQAEGLDATVLQARPARPWRSGSCRRRPPSGRRRRPPARRDRRAGLARSAARSPRPRPGRGLQQGADDGRRARRCGTYHQRGVASFMRNQVHQPVETAVSTASPSPATKSRPAAARPNQRRGSVEHRREGARPGLAASVTTISRPGRARAPRRRRPSPRTCGPRDHRTRPAAPAPAGCGRRTPATGCRRRRPRGPGGTTGRARPGCRRHRPRRAAKRFVRPRDGRRCKPAAPGQRRDGFAPLRVARNDDQQRRVRAGGQRRRRRPAPPPPRPAWVEAASSTGRRPRPLRVGLQRVVVHRQGLAGQLQVQPPVVARAEPRQGGRPWRRPAPSPGRRRRTAAGRSAAILRQPRRLASRTAAPRAGPARALRPRACRIRLGQSSLSTKTARSGRQCAQEAARRRRGRRPARTGGSRPAGSRCGSRLGRGDRAGGDQHRQLRRARPQRLDQRQQRQPLADAGAVQPDQRPLAAAPPSARPAVRPDAPGPPCRGGRAASAAAAPNGSGDRGGGAVERRGRAAGGFMRPGPRPARRLAKPAAPDLAAVSDVVIGRSSERREGAAQTTAPRPKGRGRTVRSQLFSRSAGLAGQADQQHRRARQPGQPHRRPAPSPRRAARPVGGDGDAAAALQPAQRLAEGGRPALGLGLVRSSWSRSRGWRGSPAGAMAPAMKAPSGDSEISARGSWAGPPAPGPWARPRARARCGRARSRRSARRPRPACGLRPLASPSRRQRMVASVSCR